MHYLPKVEIYMYSVSASGAEIEFEMGYESFVFLVYRVSEMKAGDDGKRFRVNSSFSSSFFFLGDYSLL